MKGWAVYQKKKKKNFLFLRLKNLFANPKWIENKNCSQNSICEEN